MIAVNRRASASGVATAPWTAVTRIAVARIAGAPVAAVLAASVAVFGMASQPSLADGGVRLSLAQIGLARIGLDPAADIAAAAATQALAPQALAPTRRAQLDPADQLVRDLAPLLGAPSVAPIDRVEAPAAAPIVLAVRALSKGSIIGPGDVVLQRRADGAGRAGRRSLAAPADALTDLASAIGQETRVSIYAGRPIRAGEVGPQTLVQRNQIVGVTYRHGAMTLRTEARALDAGGFGERIRVLNLDSRRTIFASVTGPAETEAR